MKIRQYFSREIVNRGRQDELDIVKGLAIIFMVWDHVYRDMGADTNSPIGYFIDAILGGPFAAPMFMICLGIGVGYSRHSTPALMMKRGLILVAIGYLLNFFRSTVPQLIESLLTGQMSYLNG